MVKQSYKRRHIKKTRRRHIQSRKMKGGALNAQERHELHGHGFTIVQIHSLEGLQHILPNIMNLIRQSLQQINPQTNHHFTAQEIMNTLDLDDIPANPHDAHEFLEESFDSFMSDDDDDSLNTTRESFGSDIFPDLHNSFNSSNNSLHLSDLNISHGSPNSSTNTTRESFGGKYTRKYRKNTRKSKKSKRKSKKQRGGTCYGSGVGANNYDPNFSIYNTRELQLFPYKPN